MANTKMQQLADLGQSIWLDNISRSMFTEGKLKSLIDQGLRGQTSNPTIFKQAIASSSDYDRKIQQLAQKGKSTFEIYDDLTIQDVQDACDLFKETFEQTKGLDGYVSLEINPLLANQNEEQREEGLRLWKKVNRPNLMVKVPATKSGCLVVEALLAEGANVNVTLIFSAEQYQDVALAYMNGIRKLIQKGGNPSKVRSVASVFVSRIDTAVDKILGEKISTSSDQKQKSIFETLLGQAAVANSEIIFHKYNKLFSSAEFHELEVKGAHVQRVLWASTGTKNPKYHDLKYITELIASPTVNTVPDKTLEAFLDHGIILRSLPKDVAYSQKILDTLRGYGMDVNVICLKLLAEGLTAFEQSFTELTATIEEKAKHLCTVR